jgi:hypothetical protein
MGEDEGGAVLIMLVVIAGLSFAIYQLIRALRK